MAFALPDFPETTTTAVGSWHGATSWTLQTLSTTSQVISFSGTESQLLETTASYSTLFSSESDFITATFEAGTTQGGDLYTGAFRTTTAGFEGFVLSAATVSTFSYATYSTAVWDVGYDLSGHLTSSSRPQFENIPQGNFADNQAEWTFSGTTYQSGVTYLGSQVGSLIFPAVVTASLHPDQAGIVSYPNSITESSVASLTETLHLSLSTVFPESSSSTTYSTAVALAISGNGVNAESQYVGSYADTIDLAGGQVWTVSVDYTGSVPAGLGVTSNFTDSEGTILSSFTLLTASTGTSYSFSIDSGNVLAVSPVAWLKPPVIFTGGYGGFENYTGSYFY